MFNMSQIFRQYHIKWHTFTKELDKKPTVATFVGNRIFFYRFRAESELTELIFSKNEKPRED